MGRTNRGGKVNIFLGRSKIVCSGWSSSLVGFLHPIWIQFSSDSEYRGLDIPLSIVLLSSHLSSFSRLRWLRAKYWIDDTWGLKWALHCGFVPKFSRRYSPKMGQGSPSALLRLWYMLSSYDLCISSTRIPSHSIHNSLAPLQQRFSTVKLRMVHISQTLSR